MIKDTVLTNILKNINSSTDNTIGVILPDGEEIPTEAKYRVIFKNWKALDRTLKDVEMGFGEGYIKGDIEVEGNLEDILIVGLRYLNSLEENKNISALLFKVINTISSRNKLKDKSNIQKHYDLGNDFYKLWLDSSMTYSCAFFTSPDERLEEAQREKRKIIYEKLQLKDGDRLLDIGCGWGSVMLDAAELYDIQCTGITLSQHQYNYVKAIIKKMGLSDRVEVYPIHYADIPELGKTFNKIVSIGMFEHAGRENYKAFFKTVNSVLEDGGLFLLHTIGKVYPSSTSRWIKKYIFPGGYLPAISEILYAVKDTDLCFIDIDDWRLHYYRTLKEWKRRFWNNVDKIRAMYGDEFVRRWNLYLVASAVSFYTGSNHVFELLFSKGVKNDYPVIKETILNFPVILE